MREQAQSALDPENESDAQTLVDLLDRYADIEDADSGAAATIKEEVQTIGQRLCDDGGSNLMKLIAFRVEVLDPGNTYARVRSMESFWDGICGWQV